MSDVEVELERVYTVPLSRAWVAPRYRRTVRAVNIIKEFAERHMKSGEIKIDGKLNEELWSRGITQPPRRITVKMVKDEDGLVTISLPKVSKEETAEEESEEQPSAEATSSGKAAETARERGPEEQEPKLKPTRSRRKKSKKAS